MKQFQAFKNTYSHTLEAQYLRWKYLAQKIHTLSNVMEKVPLVKEKETYILLSVVFSWAFGR